MSLTPEQLERYARHIMLRELGGPGQKALLEAHVAIVGLGALGGPAAIHLAAAGVGGLTLIDDEWGMIGSANLNGRSMHWDTEASIAFDNPAVVQNLREELARKWLGDHFDQGDTTKASTWHKAAQANAAQSPDKREGFVMPYPYKRNRRFALFLPILPSKMF